MFDAKTAKRISDGKKKLNPCLKKIEKAANSGLDSLIFEERLDKEIKEQLVDLGFKVTTVQQYRPEPLGPDIPFNFDCVSWR